MDASDAGTVQLAGRELPRLGYGAMRLPGSGVWGPPADRQQAVSVVRRAVQLGVRVVDSAWYYGPDVAHEVIAEALRPYPADLVLVTKLGGGRTADGGWYAALRPEELRAGCERDLRLLGLDAVPVTHLRWMDGEVPFADALGTMLELQREGKIERIGLSSVSLEQFEAAQRETPVATVSNLYSLSQRADEPMLRRCEAAGIPYLPFFPLASGRVHNEAVLAEVADELGVSPVRVALAWLLAHSPVMLPIPGTSSREHLEDNIAAAGLHLSPEVLRRLDLARQAAPER